MPTCGSKFVSGSSKRPQWPRVYSLGRARSYGCMPILVGDSGQVLGVQAARICNSPFVHLNSRCVVCGKEL